MHSEFSDKTEDKTGLVYRKWIYIHQPLERLHLSLSLDVVLL